jgi:hypothetical protein
MVNSNCIARERAAVNTAVGAISLTWQHVSTSSGWQFQYVKGLCTTVLRFELREASVCSLMKCYSVKFRIYIERLEG